MEARTISAVALSFSLLMAGAAGAADKVLDRTFDVTAGGTLNVNLDGGHIFVTGTDSRQVIVKVTASGSEADLERLTLSADKDGAGVAVIAEREGPTRWFGSSPKVQATISVPREYNVNLNTAGGRIDIKNLQGMVDGRTSGGRIDVASVRGEVRMRTSGGPVRIESVQGPVEINTSGGAIHVSEVTGGLRAHTSGGSIQVAGVSGPVAVHTSGGSINLDLEGENEGVVARTSGGSINLKVPSSIRASLNASTSGGRVNSNLPMSSLESTRNSLRGTLNGGGAEILAKTSGGSIHLVGK